jgi:hypothetical protein
VVDRHRGDHRGERRRDDVGGVEPAAEADLEQENVGRMTREQIEGGGRRDLELGDRPAVVDLFGPDQRVGEFVLVDERPPPASRMRSWKRTRCGEV